MVSPIWTTICLGKSSSHRSLQPYCSHWIHERGDPFSPTLSVMHFFFPVYLTFNPYHAQAARAVVKNNLSLIIFPEGTRSKNGRLLPFKKALIHPLFDHIISSHLLYNSHSGIGGNIVHDIKWQKSRRGIQANVLSTGLGSFLEYWANT